jgi:winged helix DNA-binding protein
LRTHLLRPTWHFVLPEDIRWLLQLTAPRVHALNASMYSKLELDDRVFGKSNSILVKSLEGGRHLTRKEIADNLERRAGISASGLRLGSS